MRLKLKYPIGYTHHYLEVISEPFYTHHVDKNGKSKKRISYKCKCVCGKIKDVLNTVLNKPVGRTVKSCGCKRQELTSATQFKKTCEPFDVNGKKICSKCLIGKENCEFYKQNKHKDGLASICIRCQRDYIYKWRFGFSLDIYEKLWDTQEGKCACCGTKEKSYKKLSLDHCHKSGKVRGLLCDNCNTGIGKLGDTEEGLVKAINYLKRFKNV